MNFVSRFVYCTQRSAAHAIVRFGEVVVSCKLSDISLRRTVVCAYFLLLTEINSAQFVNITPTTPVSSVSGISAASGISCYDFNYDGWDDLTIGTISEGVRTFINNEGVFEEIYLFYGMPGQYRGCTWVDMDNDGDADFFATRYNDVPVIMENLGNLLFADVSWQTTFPSLSPNSHMAGWADYDEDGLPDVYVCNYQVNGSIRNWLFHNEGNFEFENVAISAGVDNGVRESFQPSWFDYDDDGDLDLAVINDRFEGNALYSNNGDGTFDDVSASTGFGIEMDGMGISWSDVDHDDDYDVYITNTESGSYFFINEEGQYLNVADDLDLVFEGAVLYGVEFFDYDNDADDDFYTATNTAFDGGQNYFYVNEGGMNFNGDLAPAFDTDDGESYATSTADFNNDGFTDLVVLNVIPQEISIWMNDGVGGNWLKIALEGTISCRDAIGSEIHIYSGTNHFMTQTQSTESFLGQHSQYEIFGLGEINTIDSIVIEWPRGWIDRFYNISVNEKYSFTEGETFSDVMEVFSLEICSDGEAVLSNPSGETGTWSNDQIGNSIVVFEPGFYTQTILLSNGFEHQIQFDVSEFIPETTSCLMQTPSCYGVLDGTIQLSNVSNAVQWIWSNGHEGLWLDSLAAGDYSCEIVYTNSCSSHMNITLSQPDPLTNEFLNDTICDGSTLAVVMNTTGGNGNYSFDWFGANPNALTEGIHHVAISDQLGCLIQDSIEVFAHDPISITWNIPVACHNEPVAIDYEIPIEADYDFDFGEADSSEMYQGSYEILITNEHNCTSLQNITIVENDPIEITSVITHCTMSQNGSVQLNASGGVPPYQFNWDNGSNLYSIMNLEEGSYNCVVTDSLGCNAYIEIVILLDSHEELFSSELIYPNPFNDVLNIVLNTSSYIEIYNSQGQCTYHSGLNPGNNQLDLSHLAAGVYFLQINEERLVLIRE